MGCCDLLQGIFQTQELNLCLLYVLHWRWVLYHKCHSHFYIFINFPFLLQDFFKSVWRYVFLLLTVLLEISLLLFSSFFPSLCQFTLSIFCCFIASSLSLCMSFLNYFLSEIILYIISLGWFPSYFVYFFFLSSDFSSISSGTQPCPTLQPHALQHARLPCPSVSPGVLLKLMSIESVMPSNHLIIYNFYYLCFSSSFVLASC